MFGFLIIEDSTEVLFEHKSTKFFRLKTKHANNDDHIFDNNTANNNSNIYLTQILAPLMLSRSILKSEVKLDIESFKFGKTRAAFSRRSGLTFMAFTKSVPRSVLELFLDRVVELVRLLCGPDVPLVKVRFAGIDDYK